MEHMRITALPHLDLIYGPAHTHIHTHIYSNMGVFSVGRSVYAKMDKAESAACVHVCASVLEGSEHIVFDFLAKYNQPH